MPSKNKNVILVSSMHDQGVIDTDSGDQNKPEIITFYNATNGDVDVVDEFRGEYSVSRVNCRWSEVSTSMLEYIFEVGIRYW